MRPATRRRKRLIGIAAKKLYLIIERARMKMTPEEQRTADIEADKIFARVRRKVRDRR